MAGNIRGITVEINGNTEPISNALKNVNTESRNLASELKQVEKGLKLDPSNAVLLAQKQRLLAESVTNTKDKLQTLKLAETQAQQAFARGDISATQYRNLQREVISTEHNLESLERQAIQANAVLSRDGAVGNLKKIGTAVAGVAIAGTAALVGLGIAALSSADELQRQADVTGLSAERLQELKYAGSNLGVELDVITGAQAKLTKSMDAAKGGTGAQAEAFKTLGISVNDGNGHLKNAKDVMGEAFTALNKVGNETERDALSMKLFGKSAMEMNPMIKAGGAELARLTDEAKKNGAVMSNEAVAGLDKFGDTMDNLKTAVMGSVGESLAGLMPKLQAIIDKMMNLPQWIEKNSTLLTTIGVVIGTVTLLVIAFNIQQALLASGLTLWGTIAGIATGITTGLGTAFVFLTSPIGLIILAIGALILIGMLLYKNWDTIKAKLTEFKNDIVNKFTEIKNNVVNKVTEIKTGIVNKFTEIKTGITDKVQQIKDEIANKLNEIKNVITIVFTFIGHIITFAMLIIKTIISGAWLLISSIIRTELNIIVSIMQAIWSKIGGTIMSIWNGIVAFFTFVFTIIKNIFTSVWNAIAGLITTVFNSIAQVIRNVWTSITSFFTTTTSATVATTNNIWTGMMNFLTGIFNNIKAFITMIWSGISSITRSVVSGVYNFIVSIFNSVYSFISNIFNSIKTVVSNVWNSIYSVVSNIVNSISGTIRNVFSGIYSVVSGIFNNIKNAITGPIDTAKNTVSNAVNAMKGFFTGLLFKLPHIDLPHFSLKGSFSLAPPKVPSLGVDWYDKGGIFNTPNIIGVGEKRPEFVGALDDLREIVRSEIKGAGSNIGNLLHADNVNINNGMDIENLATELAFFMKQKQLGGSI